MFCSLDKVWFFLNVSFTFSVSIGFENTTSVNTGAWSEIWLLIVDLSLFFDFHPFKFSSSSFEITSLNVL
ncbi:hypothetical protein [Metamycoplasma hominis]|uniref:hypothetical protein n=1 Tax=Metamycoplasma hominis TaxID=2098 RepID=UPI00215D7996|nr:hypothetical protein [Metamycoplasma hominis]